MKNIVLFILAFFLALMPFAFNHIIYVAETRVDDFKKVRNQKVKKFKEVKYDDWLNNLSKIIVKVECIDDNGVEQEFRLLYCYRDTLKIAR
jgi:hypothetical protein